MIVGGYYADWDTVCHWPFQNHFQDYECVVALEGGGKINNAFMGASLGSRPLAELLEGATNRILGWAQERAPPVCWPAGPDLLTDTIRGQLGTLVLPAHRAISYRAGVVDRSCYLSHLYASVTGDQLDPSRAYQWRASSSRGGSSASNGSLTGYKGGYEGDGKGDYGGGYSGDYSAGVEANWKPESQWGEMPAPKRTGSGSTLPSSIPACISSPLARRATSGRKMKKQARETEALRGSRGAYPSHPIRRHISQRFPGESFCRGE